MDGFVTDYISNFTGEMGRQPTYEEYAQIMTGFTPEQIPVLNGLARGFGVFDHWFCEVPSQTFPNRSFWTAATSSGFCVNAPTTKFISRTRPRRSSTGSTITARRGRSTSRAAAFSGTGLIHYQRLKDRVATHFVPFSQFETDAANGDLPDFSFIEPNLTIGHNDYHPAVGRAMGHGVAMPGVDPPSSILGGEEFLSRIYTAYRGMQGTTGSNVWNTTLLIGWDEPGGTYDHVPPPAVPTPDPTAPAGEHGFAFDRSGYRVPAIIVSPWVAEGEVFNEEYRHTSLIATLREQWALGDPFTARDAAARTFSNVFTLDTPRDPKTWPDPKARPVPQIHAGHGGTRTSPLRDRQGPPRRDPRLRSPTQPRDRRTPQRPQGRCTPGTSGERAARLRRELLPAPDHDNSDRPRYPDHALNGSSEFTRTMPELPGG